MHGPKTFDTKARERIRQKLLQYKMDHAVGVHKLAYRISEVHPAKPEIAIKALQNFLADTRRTNDQYVGYYNNFAEALPEVDPVGDLGKAMSAVYNTKSRPSLALDGLNGTFNVTLIEGQTGVLEITKEHEFWRLHEAMSARSHLIYDGVMVETTKALLVLLKDRLMGQPKIYMLRVSNSDLEGHGSHVDFSADRTIGVVSITRRGNG